MNTELNKLQQLIKDLYENYNASPFVNEKWNDFIKEGYNLLYPDSKRNMAECYNCKEIIKYSDDDIIDGYYVICPDCGEHVVIL